MPLSASAAAESLLLWSRRAERLGVRDAGGRIGLADRQISVDDPILPGISVPEDWGIDCANLDSFARVMCVGFPRQSFEGKRDSAGQLEEPAQLCLSLFFARTAAFRRVRLGPILLKEFCD